VTTIAVLGAGSWGTTLANLLARKGAAEVRLWAYEPEVAGSINDANVNELFLPGVPLSPRLRASSDARETVRGADMVLSVIPSHAVRSVTGGLNGAVPRGTLVVSATKGIEADSLKLMSEVLSETLDQPEVAILSGPSFAEEVGRDEPTAVVAAATSDATATRVQDVFSTPAFRVYSNQDPVGVQLGGALKNISAIAAGMLEGLGLGNNPRAALVTRGLAEITRLGLAMGAQPMTFAGLAGLGDLVGTCMSPLSRNRTFGEALGRGQSLEEAQRTTRFTAEGVKSCLAIRDLARAHGVDMPITEQVERVCHEGVDPKVAVKTLMSRATKPE
jgi:glycerol-3-phosphate dehydrogenase (NAD(P)+)